MLKLVLSLFRIYWRCGPAVIGTAALAFSFTALAIKLIGDSVPPFETVSASGLLCLVALTGVLRHCELPLLPKGSPADGASAPSFDAVFYGGGGSFSGNLPVPISKARVMLLTLLRGVLGSAATTAFILSLEVLPLRDAVTLFFTSPVIALLLDWQLRGRPPGCCGTAATGLTLAGALLVTHPHFLFGGTVAPSGTPGLHSAAAAVTSAGGGDGDSNGGGRGLSSAGVTLALGAAAANALGFVTIGLLQGRQHPLVLTWWYNLVLVVMTAAPSALRWPLPPALPSRRGALLLLGVGSTQLVAQLCLNRGFQLEPAGRGATINVLQVLFSFLLDVVVLGDVPSPLSVGGSALVAAGVLLVATSGKRRGGANGGGGGASGGAPQVWGEFVDSCLAAATKEKRQAAGCGCGGDDGDGDGGNVTCGGGDGGGGGGAHRVVIHAVAANGVGAVSSLYGSSLSEPLLPPPAAAGEPGETGRR